MMASELAETCHFINTNKLVVFEVPYTLLIVTYATGMPQVRIINYMFRPMLLWPSSGWIQFIREAV